jgi:hypothetical protein
MTPTRANNAEIGGTLGMGRLEIAAYTRSQRADLPARREKIDLARNLVRQALLFR